MQVIGRHLVPVVGDFISTFRVVLVAGARQVGKTTMVRELISLPHAVTLNLDHEATLRRALDDPSGLLDSTPGPVVIDEYQRAGRGLLLAVKARADTDPKPGQVILTGSTGYVASRLAVDTLAGRMGRVHLWSLSQDEIDGGRSRFLDDVFEPGWAPAPRSASWPRTETVERVLRGGYPEVVSRDLDPRSRGRWFQSYVQEVVSREALNPVADVRRERELRLILRLVAARLSTEVVTSDLANDAGISRNTAADYVGLLEALDLVHPVPAWASSATTRARRRPKLVITDSGLAAHLTSATTQTFGPAADGVLAGALFENWVVGELLRQSGWADREVDVLAFRDREGREVDALIEDRATGRLVGIEAKLTATPSTRDARWLAWLRDSHSDRFAQGLVVHAGGSTLPLGDRLWAVPVTTVLSG